MRLIKFSNPYEIRKIDFISAYICTLYRTDLVCLWWEELECEERLILGFEPRDLF